MKKTKRHFTCRKAARSMARRNMKRAGMKRINHRSKEDGKTPFQKKWRGYVFQRSVI